MKELAMFAESPRPRQELAIESFSHFEIVHRSILESKRMLQIDVLNERLLSFEDQAIKQRWPFAAILGAKADHYSLVIETSGDNYRCVGQSQQEVQYIASLCNLIPQRQLLPDLTTRDREIMYTGSASTKTGTAVLVLLVPGKVFLFAGTVQSLEDANLRSPVQAVPLDSAGIVRERDNATITIAYGRNNKEKLRIRLASPAECDAYHTALLSSQEAALGGIPRFVIPMQVVMAPAAVTQHSRRISQRTPLARPKAGSAIDVAQGDNAVVTLTHALAADDFQLLDAAMKSARSAGKLNSEAMELLGKAKERHSQLRVRAETAHGTLGALQSEIEKARAKRSSASSLVEAIQLARAGGADSKAIDQRVSEAHKLLESVVLHAEVARELSERVKRSALNPPLRRDREIAIMHLERDIAKCVAISPDFARSERDEANRLIHAWQMEDTVLKEVERAMESRDYHSIKQALGNGLGVQSMNVTMLHEVLQAVCGRLEHENQALEGQVRALQHRKRAEPAEMNGHGTEGMHRLVLPAKVQHRIKELGDDHEDLEETAQKETRFLLAEKHAMKCHRMSIIAEQCASGLADAGERPADSAAPMQFSVHLNESIFETVTRFKEVSADTELQVAPEDLPAVVPALFRLLDDYSARARQNARRILESAEEAHFRTSTSLPSLIKAFDAFPSEVWGLIKRHFSDMVVVNAVLNNTINGIDCNQLLPPNGRTMLHVLVAARHEDSELWRLDMCTRLIRTTNLEIQDDFGLTPTDYGKRTTAQRIWWLFKLKELLLLRYKLCCSIPIHTSRTSEVFQARDKKVKDKVTGATAMVAVKRLTTKENLLRELENRGVRCGREGFDEHFVVEVLRAHVVEDCVETILGPNGDVIETNQLDGLEDGYYIIMPFSYESLHHAQDAGRFSGVSFPICEMIVRQLAECIKHVHDHGVVHGDVKARNVLKIHERWRLSDFDSAVPVGNKLGPKVVPGACPANASPQFALTRLLSDYSFEAIEKNLHEDNKLTPDELQACLDGLASLRSSGKSTLETFDQAHPTFDIFGLGLVMYSLFTGGASLFRMNNDDNVDSMSEWLRMVLWEGINEADLTSRVFSKAPPGTVTSSQKDEAMQVIAACLEPDPTKRPQSIEHLLQLPFFMRAEASAKLLFVSTPGKGKNPKTGQFDYDVMGHLQTLCRRYRGSLIVAYDWAGSSSADPRDTPFFNMIFEDKTYEGTSLFAAWAAEPSEEKKAKYIVEVEKILQKTMWWASYKGSVKAQIRETCQCGLVAILVRIDGGPITRVEANNLSKLIVEVKSDLKMLGHNDPQIELDAYESVQAFHKELPAYLSRLYKHAGGAMITASAPSLEAVQQELLQKHMKLPGAAKVSWWYTRNKIKGELRQQQRAFLVPLLVCSDSVSEVQSQLMQERERANELSKRVEWTERALAIAEKQREDSMAHAARAEKQLEKQLASQRAGAPEFALQPSQHTPPPARPGVPTRKELAQGWAGWKLRRSDPPAAPVSRSVKHPSGAEDELSESRRPITPQEHSAPSTVTPWGSGRATTGALRSYRAQKELVLLRERQLQLARTPDLRALLRAQLKQDNRILSRQEKELLRLGVAF